MKKITILSLTVIASSFVLLLLMMSPMRIQALEFVSSLPEGQVGVVYPPTSLFNSFAGPTVIVTSETPFPVGMVVNDQGILSGTPQEIFNNCLNIKATDAENTYQSGICLNIKPAGSSEPPIVSTGHLVGDIGKISVMGTNTITVDGKLVRIVDNTRIIKLKKNYSLEVGQWVAYTGMKNTDGSVTARLIIIGR